MSERIAVLMIGANGSIAATLTTGVFALQAGIGSHDGMLTSQAAFTAANLLSPNAFVFGGWDLLHDANHAAVAKSKAEAPSEIICAVADQLAQVEIMPGVALGISDAVRTRISNGTPIDRRRDEAAKRIENEIYTFISRRSLDGAVIVNLASTEPPIEPLDWHESLDGFENALANDDPRMPAGMVYAYAAIRAGCPIINYTPSDVFEIPALQEFAVERRVPLAGRDGKTGQTFYKSVLASAFKDRGMNVEGWYSTNILGNDDGLILDDPLNGESKRRSKVQVLEQILQYQPDHQVHIHYYRPRLHQKEAWDCIDLRGWLGAAIQMKINWIAPDSALAAPMVFDLIRLLWWAKRRGNGGVQGYLGVFFKDALGCPTFGFSDQMQLLKSVIARA